MYKIHVNAVQGCTKFYMYIDTNSSHSMYMYISIIIVYTCMVNAAIGTIVNAAIGTIVNAAIGTSY